MSRKPQYAEYDPWDTYDPHGGNFVRVNPKRTRKLTLAAAMKAAQRAGAAVSGATFKADGTIELAFGKGPTASTTPDAEHLVIGNEWDEVLH